MTVPQLALDEALFSAYGIRIRMRVQFPYTHSFGSLPDLHLWNPLHLTRAAIER